MPVLITLLVLSAASAQASPDPVSVTTIDAAVDSTGDDVDDAPRVAVATKDEMARDGGTRAIEALPVVLIGAGIGIVVGATLVGSGLFAITSGIAPVLGLAVLLASPTLAVALFSDRLAPWTWALVPVTTGLGFGVGALLGGVAGFAVFSTTTTPSDCTYCGIDTVYAIAVPGMILGAVVGAGGAVLATTIGAYAQAGREGRE